ncbi:MAG TPA: hypothetical protein VGR22_04105 [Thermomicrobiales bacterium]|nr:hypothetical protein [Thermomicrobiales bacterium]
MTSDGSARLSRRQVIVSAVGGALLGSAWGLALGEASSDDRRPV